jgi:hypothetical protein
LRIAPEAREVLAPVDESEGNLLVVVTSIGSHDDVAQDNLHHLSRSRIMALKLLHKHSTFRLCSILLALRLRSELHAFVYLGQRQFDFDLGERQYRFQTLIDFADEALFGPAEGRN